MSTSVLWRRCLLFGILLCGGFLRFWNLVQNGFGNYYYAAAVRSMRGDAARFFFAAYDPGGFLSVDKPPAALWVQTLATFVGGYQGLALLLPQAIAGTIAIWLLYRLVARNFGAVAGLTSALFLALTPIVVAVDRMNLPDSLLILTLLAATALFQRAVHSENFVSLFAAAFVLGMGFQIKMWEAVILAPVLGLIYLRFANVPLPERLVRLAGAGLVLLILSLSWVTAVDLTPAERRPYVGGSRNNSATDLILVYNGWERLTGGRDQLSDAMLGDGGPLASLGAMPGFWAGRPGGDRLFRPALGTQVMWWFGISLCGVLLIPLRWRDLNREQQAAIGIWSGWFLVFAVVLSAAGGTVHPYYFSVLAPGIAALGGIGVTFARRESVRRRYVLPVAITVAALFQVYLLWPYGRMYPILWAGPIAGLLASPVTVVGRLRDGAVFVAFVFLSFCPLYWCWTAVAVPGNGLTPSTGPEVAAGAWRFPPPAMPASFTQKLTTFLVANRGKQRFVLATGGVYNASPIIVSSGLPVMAMGGFLGSDPILTPATLAHYVNTGQVRFLLFSSGDGLPGNTYLPPLGDWARDHCRAVDPARWMDYRPGYGMEFMTLYDCR